MLLALSLLHQLLIGRVLTTLVLSSRQYQDTDSTCRGWRHARVACVRQVRVLPERVQCVAYGVCWRARTGGMMNTSMTKYRKSRLTVSDDFGLVPSLYVRFVCCLLPGP